MHPFPIGPKTIVPMSEINGFSTIFIVSDVRFHSSIRTIFFFVFNRLLNSKEDMERIVGSHSEIKYTDYAMFEIRASVGARCADIAMCMGHS